MPYAVRKRFAGRDQDSHEVGSSGYAGAGQRNRTRASLGMAVSDGISLSRPVMTFDGRVIGEASLPPEIFGQEPRIDVMHAYVKWQDSRRHDGQHKTQARNEVSLTGAKMYKQKGTGRARHGSGRAAQFVGGAKAHGPVLRNVETKLPKKVRRLGLASALSARAMHNRVQLVDDEDIESYKTADLARRLEELGIRDVLIVTGDADCDNLKMASRNLRHVDLLSVDGLNVRSILLRDHLVLTVGALNALGNRYDVPVEVRVERRSGQREAKGAGTVGRVISTLTEYRGRIRRRPQEPPEQTQSRDRPLEKALPDRNLFQYAARSAPAPSQVNVSGAEARESDGTNIELRRYARTLRLGLGSERIEVMKSLRSTRPQGPWKEEMVRRLLPLLASDDQVEAMEAARTLCALRYNDERLRADLLTAIMHDEGVEFVTYVDALDRTDSTSKVRLRARLSRTLPLDIDGKAVTLGIPDWLEQAKSISVRVSGPAVRAGSVRAHKVAPAVGDMMAKEVEFDLDSPGEQEVLIDFYADNRWLDRQTLNLRL